MSCHPPQSIWDGRYAGLSPPTLPLSALDNPLPVPMLSNTHWTAELLSPSSIHTALSLR